MPRLGLEESLAPGQCRSREVIFSYLHRLFSYINLSLRSKRFVFLHYESSFLFLRPIFSYFFLHSHFTLTMDDPKNSNGDK